VGKAHGEIPVGEALAANTGANQAGESEAGRHVDQSFHHESEERVEILTGAAERNAIGHSRTDIDRVTIDLGRINAPSGTVSKP